MFFGSGGIALEPGDEIFDLFKLSIHNNGPNRKIKLMRTGGQLGLYVWLNSWLSSLARVLL